LHHPVAGAIASIHPVRWRRVYVAAKVEARQRPSAFTSGHSSVGHEYSADDEMTGQGKVIAWFRVSVCQDLVVHLNPYAPGSRTPSDKKLATIARSWPASHYRGSDRIYRLVSILAGNRNFEVGSQRGDGFR
jgi:hypothetical protein